MGGSAIPIQPELNPTSKPTQTRCEPKQEPRKTLFVLGLLLASYLAFETFIPLRTAVQIGADEGFELAKATLCLHGQHLYTEVWNDQPPLHTFLVTEILRYLSPSILGPRLLTIGFALMRIPTQFGQRSDFSRTVIRFNSDAVPIQFGQRSGE